MSVSETVLADIFDELAQFATKVKTILLKKRAAEPSSIADSDQGAAKKLKKKRGPSAKSSYNFFVSDYMKSHPPTEDKDLTKNRMHECAILWKSMSEEDKEPFREQAVADKDRLKNAEVPVESSSSETDEASGSETESPRSPVKAVAKPLPKPVVPPKPAPPKPVAAKPVAAAAPKPAPAVSKSAPALKSPVVKPVAAASSGTTDKHKKKHSSEDTEEAPTKKKSNLNVFEESPETEEAPAPVEKPKKKKDKHSNKD